MQVGAKREAINGWYIEPFDVYFDSDGNLDIQSVLNHPNVLIDVGFGDEIQYDLKVVKWYNQATGAVIDYAYAPYFTRGPLLCLAGGLGTYTDFDSVSNSSVFNNGRIGIFVQNQEVGGDDSYKSYMNIHFDQDPWEGGAPSNNFLGGEADPPTRS